jgi:hypothetical protein
MKKLVAAGVCALAVAVVAPIPVAQAEDARCATKSEYRKVRAGMSKPQVAQIIDYNGAKFYRFDVYETREYASCTHEDRGFVLVSYAHGEVTKKSAMWG